MTKFKAPAAIEQKFMRQAIVTRVLRATNSRGTRIKATAQAGSITIGYDEAGSTPEERHAAAAAALSAKFGWDNRDYYGPLIGGALPDGSYVFVEVPREVAQVYGAYLGPKYEITARTWYGKNGGEYKAEMREVKTGNIVFQVDGGTWGSDAWAYAMRDAMNDRPDMFPSPGAMHPTIYFRDVAGIEYDHREVQRKRDL